ncbi:class II aldolase/adducin family protein [Pseudoflavonifractor phocaeensis]|uniref:class II aldolase/adducin family protein n=1 Tax=Pseudoflavonifractor phocaeensis TaxID=1870988 RepID=UPI00308C33C5|nr:aldolase [Oscillospiraceae bacterium]
MYEKLRQEICDICHLLYDRGYVVSNDGNVSARTEGGTILITPSGVGKGRMTPDMLVETDLDGHILSGDRHPSSESKMHWMVYRERSDVNAVVHAHPPMSTAFAVCRRPLKEKYLAELVVGLGEVPVTEFAMLSTDEVPNSVKPFVRDHSAVLLANHGALAWGPSLLSAFDRMETVEQTAKVYYYVGQMGGGVEMTEEQADTLKSMTGFYQKLAQKRED